MDLYDRVSYLDLVDQHEKQQRRKREERAERLRKIMDGYGRRTSWVDYGLTCFGGSTVEARI